MDTCAINCWRKRKSRTTIKKSIYSQPNLCCGEGPENWSAIIICSFHWIIFCCRLLLKEVNELNVNFFSLSFLMVCKIKLVHPTFIYFFIVLTISSFLGASVPKLWNFQISHTRVHTI